MESMMDEMEKAVSEGWLAEVGSLIAHGEDPHAVDGKRRNALMLEAWSGHDEIVKALLPVGDPMAKNMKGMTALMWAAAGGHAKCVETLLPVRDPLAVDEMGLNAAALARKGGPGGIAARIEAFALARVEGRAISEASLGRGREARRRAL